MSAPVRPEPRRIVANTLSLTLSRILERGSGIVLAILIARLDGPADLGLYAGALAYYGAIVVAGELGVVNLLTREIAKDRNRTSEYVVHASVILGAVGVALTGLALALVWFLPIDYDLMVNIALIVPALLPALLNSAQEAVFISHQRVQYKTNITALISAVNVAVGATLLATGHGVRSLLVLLVALEFATAIFYYWIISRRLVRLTFAFDQRKARALARDAAPFAGSSLLGAIFARPEIVLLSMLTNARQVGLYSAASRLVDLCNEIPNLLMTNVFPVFSRLYHEGDSRVHEVRAKAIRGLMYFALPLAVGIFVAAEDIVQALFGTKFAASVTPMRILALGIPVVALQAVLWRALSIRGEQHLVLRTQVQSVVARIGGGAALIARFSTVGAAIAPPIGYLINVVLMQRFFRRDGSRLDLAALSAGPLAASVIMGVVAWLLLRDLSIWAVIPIATLVYAVAVSLTLMRRPFFAHVREEGTG